mmetsp:Transcript_7751/g.22160  ORF Transcript_7751/g.22160 Transcript_7751/m.22160 type:complete len:237 (-) Transcript_7751:1214-1924(-)
MRPTRHRRAASPSAKPPPCPRRRRPPSRPRKRSRLRSRRRRSRAPPRRFPPSAIRAHPPYKICRRRHRDARGPAVRPAMWGSRTGTPASGRSPPARPRTSRWGRGEWTGTRSPSSASQPPCLSRPAWPRPPTRRPADRRPPSSGAAGPPLASPAATATARRRVSRRTRARRHRRRLGPSCGPWPRGPPVVWLVFWSAADRPGRSRRSQAVAEPRRPVTLPPAHGDSMPGPRSPERC